MPVFMYVPINLCLLVGLKQRGIDWAHSDPAEPQCCRDTQQGSEDHWISMRGCIQEKPWTVAYGMPEKCVF